MNSPDSNPDRNAYAGLDLTGEPAGTADENGVGPFDRMPDSGAEVRELVLLAQLFRRSPLTPPEGPDPFPLGEERGGIINFG